MENNLRGNISPSRTRGTVGILLRTFPNISESIHCSQFSSEYIQNSSNGVSLSEHDLLLSFDIFVYKDVDLYCRMSIPYAVDEWDVRPSLVERPAVVEMSKKRDRDDDADDASATGTFLEVLLERRKSMSYGHAYKKKISESENLHEGRYYPEEMAFIKSVLDAFVNGELDCPDGTRLLPFLSEALYRHPDSVKDAAKLTKKAKAQGKRCGPFGEDYQKSTRKVYRRKSGALLLMTDELARSIKLTSTHEATAAGSSSQRNPSPPDHDIPLCWLVSKDLVSEEDLSDRSGSSSGHGSPSAQASMMVDFQCSGSSSGYGSPSVQASMMVDLLPFNPSEDFLFEDFKYP